jgi:hypothetical protein
VETQSNEQQLAALLNDPELLMGRAPANVGDHIAGVSVDDLRRVAAVLLRPQNRLWVVEEPNKVLFWAAATSLLVLAGVLLNVLQQLVKAALIWLRS